MSEPRKKADKPDAAASETATPSKGVRTVVTYLLFLHLFAVGVAVTSNFGARGGLRLQLREVPGIRPYLQTLNLDTAYSYHLVFGNREDWDYQCEVELNRTGDGPAAPGAEKIELMPPDAWPGTRRRRYLMLGLNTALNEGNEQIESVLPAGLANGMLRRHSVQGGTHRFRCVGLAPLRMSDFDLPGTNDRPLRSTTVYEADLVSGPTGWDPVKRADQLQRTQSGRVVDENP
jgi:hypothetical protein